MGYTLQKSSLSRSQIACDVFGSLFFNFKPYERHLYPHVSVVPASRQLHGVKAGQRDKLAVYEEDTSIRDIVLNPLSTSAA